MGLMLGVLERARRGRGRRAPRQAAALGPRRALVSRDRDDPVARRRSGSSRTAPPRRWVCELGRGRWLAHPDAVGRSGARRAHHIPLAFRSPHPRPQPRRWRSGTSSTASRCTSRRQSASTATTSCRSCTGTESSAASSPCTTARPGACGAGHDARPARLGRPCRIGARLEAVLAFRLRHVHLESVEETPKLVRAVAVGHELVERGEECRARGGHGRPRHPDGNPAPLEVAHTCERNRRSSDSRSASRHGIVSVSGYQRSARSQSRCLPRRPTTATSPRAFSTPSMRPILRSPHQRWASRLRLVVLDLA